MRQEEVFKAIRAGRLAELERCVTPTFDIDGLGSGGERALCLAVEAGRPQIVAWALDRGADPNRPDGAGWTPPMLCVRESQSPGRSALQDAIRKMLEDAGGSFAEQAAVLLWVAAGGGDTKRVQALLADGTVPQTSRLGPLVRAAMHGHIDTIELLLAAGADKEWTKDGMTALCVAAQHGQLEAAKSLTLAGANANPPGARANATYFATRGGHSPVAAWLKANGGGQARRRLGVTYRAAGLAPGWALLEKHSEFGANGEYSLVFVRSPLEDVSPSLQAELGSQRRLCGIDVTPQFLLEGESIRFAVQLVDSTWTLFVHEHGNIVAPEEGHRVAQALSRELSCEAFHATWDDTTCDHDVVRFERGQSTRSHASALADAAKTGVPAIAPAGEWGPKLIGVSRVDVDRVDGLVDTASPSP